MCVGAVPGPTAHVLLVSWALSLSLPLSLSLALSLSLSLSLSFLTAQTVSLKVQWRGVPAAFEEWLAIEPILDDYVFLIPWEVVPVSSTAPEGWGTKDGGNAMSLLHSRRSRKKKRQHQKSRPPLGVTMMPLGAPSISKYGSSLRP